MINYVAVNFFFIPVMKFSEITHEIFDDLKYSRIFLMVIYLLSIFNAKHSINHFNTHNWIIYISSAFFSLKC